MSSCPHHVDGIHLIPIKQHCILAAKSIIEVSGTRDNSAAPFKGNSGKTAEMAYDWIMNAASIETISLDPDPDNGTMMCRPAWEYAETRGKLLEQFMARFVRFNFIWTGFEILTDLISPKNDGARKKTATILLRDHYDPLPRIGEFDPVLECFKCHIRDSHLFNTSLKEFCETDDCTTSGIAIHVCSTLRNSFAHGSLHMPEPNDWNWPTRSNSDEHVLRTIGLASRLMLLSIQMLLVGALNREGLSGQQHHPTSLFTEDDEINLKDFLMTSHRSDITW